MAIHWKIPFKSLRAGDDYVVNIYDDSYTGTAVVLKGGAAPFETQEDDDEDQFTPVRLQSGYLRIVDDGKDANGNTLSAADSWKALAPQHDFARPVTLTKGNVVMWQGYMQAQNFGSKLYGDPQEREFPVQCILTVMGAKDVDSAETNVHNFAYLINRVFAAIGITTSSVPVGIDYFYFQGGGWAKVLLRKLVDWQNFVSDDDNGSISSRFDMLTVLEDVCRFWGWTVRTSGRSVYFTCADDATDAPGLLRLTLAQLQSIGSNPSTDVGTLMDYADVELDGEIFASTTNDDLMMRGASTAVVTADPGNADENLFEAFPEYIEKQMLEGGWQQRIYNYNGWQGVNGNSGEWKQEEAYAKYTVDKTSLVTPFFKITCLRDASLNLAQFSQNESDIRYGTNISYLPVIRLQQVANNQPYVQMETVFHHVFDGDFIIKGDVYKSGYCYKTDSQTMNHTIKMKFGIGKTRGTAQWYQGNGYGWSSTETIFEAHVNFNDGVWRFGDGVYDTINVVSSSTGKTGKVFIDLYGGGGEHDWLPDGVESDWIYLDIAGLELKYNRFGLDLLKNTTRAKLDDRKEYKASNNNMSRQKWNADTVYASGNLDFGFGLVFDPDTQRPIYGISYPSGTEAPEQHLADRVAGYWSVSRRMLNTELRTDEVGSITPGQMITIDDTVCHPIAIGHQWRDDITKVSLLEMPQ